MKSSSGKVCFEVTHKQATYTLKVVNTTTIVFEVS